MLLAIDVGNTNLKFGLFAGDHLVEQWRVATQRHLQGDELAMLLVSLLRESGRNRSDVTQVAIASVVPVLTAQLVPMCEHWFGLKPLVVGPGTDTGLTLDGKPLHELGADRIVQCVGALRLERGPVVVVALGTATVIDVVGPDGAYLGGAIAPGLKTSADALYARAALLREVALVAPPSALGRNTTSQLQSGLILGWAGLIDGLVSRMRRDLAAPDAPVVATGGLAELVAPHSATITRVAPELALLGLKEFWATNRKEAGS